MDEDFSAVGQAVLVGIRPLGRPVEPHPGVAGGVRIFPDAHAVSQGQVRCFDFPRALQPVVGRGHRRPDDIRIRDDLVFLVGPSGDHHRRGVPDRVGEDFRRGGPVRHRQLVVTVGQFPGIGESKLAAG